MDVGSHLTCQSIGLLYFRHLAMESVPDPIYLLEYHSFFNIIRLDPESYKYVPTVFPKRKYTLLSSWVLKTEGTRWIAGGAPNSPFLNGWCGTPPNFPIAPLDFEYLISSKVPQLTNLVSSCHHTILMWRPNSSSEDFSILMLSRILRRLLKTATLLVGCEWYQSAYYFGWCPYLQESECINFLGHRIGIHL